MSNKPLNYLLLIALLVSACAMGPADPNEHYVLTDKDLHPSSLIVTDRREPSERLRADIERGYRIGDAALSPSPDDFLKSELSRLGATEPEFVKAIDFLNAKPVLLQKFSVALQRQDYTNQPSKQPAPGLAATEYVIRGMTGRLFAYRDVVVEIEIEVDGKRYASGPVTWTTNVLPYSNATVFPASFAVRKLLHQINAANN
jgi:hypothetical protein